MSSKSRDSQGGLADRDGPKLVVKEVVLAATRWMVEQMVLVLPFSEPIHKEYVQKCLADNTTPSDLERSDS